MTMESKCKDCVDWAEGGCKEKCGPMDGNCHVCASFRRRRNSEVIDGPDYYALPDGTQLEDAMWALGLDGPTWSAIKYLWRAGKKDGESAEKDSRKVVHYATFRARMIGTTVDFQFIRLDRIYDEIVRRHGLAEEA